MSEEDRTMDDLKESMRGFSDKGKEMAEKWDKEDEQKKRITKFIADGIQVRSEKYAGMLDELKVFADWVALKKEYYVSESKAILEVHQLSKEHGIKHSPGFEKSFQLFKTRAQVMAGLNEKEELKGSEWAILALLMGMRADPFEYLMIGSLIGLDDY